MEKWAKTLNQKKEGIKQFPGPSDSNSSQPASSNSLDTIVTEAKAAPAERSQPQIQFRFEAIPNPKQVRFVLILDRMMHAWNLI